MNQHMVVNGPATTLRPIPLRSAKRSALPTKRYRRVVHSVCCTRPTTNSSVATVARGDGPHLRIDELDAARPLSGRAPSTATSPAASGCDRLANPARLRRDEAPWVRPDLRRDGIASRVDARDRTRAREGTRLRDSSFLETGLGPIPKRWALYTSLRVDRDSLCAYPDGRVQPSPRLQQISPRTPLGEAARLFSSLKHSCERVRAPDQPERKRDLACDPLVRRGPRSTRHARGAGAARPPARWSLRCTRQLVRRVRRARTRPSRKTPGCGFAVRFELS